MPSPINQSVTSSAGSVTITLPPPQAVRVNQSFTTFQPKVPVLDHLVAQLLGAESLTANHAAFLASHPHAWVRATYFARLDADVSLAAPDLLVWSGAFTSAFELAVRADDRSQLATVPVPLLKRLFRLGVPPLLLEPALRLLPLRVLRRLPPPLVAVPDAPDAALALFTRYATTSQLTGVLADLTGPLSRAALRGRLGALDPRDPAAGDLVDTLVSTVAWGPDLDVLSLAPGQRPLLDFWRGVSEDLAALERSEVLLLAQSSPDRALLLRIAALTDDQATANALLARGMPEPVAAGLAAFAGFPTLQACVERGVPLPLDVVERVLDKVPLAPFQVWTLLDGPHLAALFDRLLQSHPTAVLNHHSATLADVLRAPARALTGFHDQSAVASLVFDLPPAALEAFHALLGEWDGSLGELLTAAQEL